MRRLKVAVKQHPDVRRTKRWQVGYRDVDRKRRAEFYLTRAEADVRAEALRIEIRNFGLTALSMPDSVRLESQQALEILRPYGKGLIDAARHYAGHLERNAKSRNIEDVIEDFLLTKQAAKVSARHISDMRSRLGLFTRSFRGRSARNRPSVEMKTPEPDAFG